MNPLGLKCFAPNRRQFLKSILAASSAPLFVPAHVLGAAGKTPPSGKITVGVLGVGAQGQPVWVAKTRTAIKSFTCNHLQSRCYGPRFVCLEFIAHPKHCRTAAAG